MCRTQWTRTHHFNEDRLSETHRQKVEMDLLGVTETICRIGGTNRLEELEVSVFEPIARKLWNLSDFCEAPVQLKNHQVVVGEAIGFAGFTISVLHHVGGDHTV